VRSTLPDPRAVRRTRARRIIIKAVGLAAAIFVVAGCGASSQSSTSAGRNIAVQPLKDCLDRAGAASSFGLDSPLAKQASSSFYGFSPTSPYADPQSQAFQATGINNVRFYVFSDSETAARVMKNAATKEAGYTVDNHFGIGTNVGWSYFGVFTGSNPDPALDQQIVSCVASS